MNGWLTSVQPDKNHQMSIKVAQKSSNLVTLVDNQCWNLQQVCLLNQVPESSWTRTRLTLTRLRSTATTDATLATFARVSTGGWTRHCRTRRAANISCPRRTTITSAKPSPDFVSKVAMQGRVNSPLWPPCTPSSWENTTEWRLAWRWEKWFFELWWRLVSQRSVVVGRPTCCLWMIC